MNDSSDVNSGNLAVEPEFSYVVEVEKIPSLGRMFKLEADETQRDQLKKRLGLASFEHFRTEIKVVPLGRSSIYELRGRVIASLAQPCVVSLDPVYEEIDEEFDVRFAPERDYDGEEREFVLSEQDDYEVLENGKIDIAEMATQHLSLSLNPYPRLDDAELSSLQNEAAKQGRNFEVNGPKANPFSALSALKK